MINLAPAARRAFPPLDKATVKAVACELPAKKGEPVSVYHISDIKRILDDEGQVLPMSKSTVCRILKEDALRPWRHHPWVHPRDPEFREKAEVVLDLYQGYWRGQHLGEDDYVICYDEKPGIQCLKRCHPSFPTGPSRPVRIEHEYIRLGTIQYMAAWDVFRGKVYGDCVPSVTKPVFHKFVGKVMSQKVYKKAHRVIWVLDNGTCHRTDKQIMELERLYPNMIVVNLPLHASWLNQAEIYLSILVRKVLTPNDSDSVDDLIGKIIGFQNLYSRVAKPFNWRFTRNDLYRYLKSLELVA